MNKKSFAGKRGENIRSDCYFEIELKNSGGIKIEIKSKVSSMYGESIKKQIEVICRFFRTRNAEIYFEDAGALPFIIAARLESRLKS
jgi:citrate lyase subunit beta/citryl-CoA lyase